VVSERWLPVSPNGRLDGFEWKVPLAEIGVTRPVIEVAPPAAAPAAVPAPELKPAPPDVPPEKPRKAAKASATAKAKPAEPVIPLVHAPDDPGLDSGLDHDPVPEPTIPPAVDAWQRLRQLFR
jgi:HemY protein